jgi:hypothetical protein
MTDKAASPDTSAPAAEKTDEQIWAEFAAAEGETAKQSPEDKALANDAFAGDPENATEEPKPSDPDASPAPAQTPAASVDEAPAAAPDPWASAPPELKAAHDAQVRALENATSEQARKSIQGRIDAYTRRLEERKAAAAKPAEPDPTEPEDPLATLEKDYPEIADPFKKLVAPLQEEVSRLKAREKAAQEAADLQMDQDLKANEIKLEEKHPDIWDVLRQNGAAFGDWIVNQPLAIRTAAFVNKDAIVDLDGAIRTFDAFKAHLNGNQQPPAQPATPPAQQAPKQEPDDLRAAQLAASTTPRVTGGKPTVSGIPKDGDPEAIWKMMQETDEEEKQYRTTRRAG